MKIIITEEQFTIIDWYNHNENLFESIFNHLINGPYIKNFVWSDDIDFVCDKIINRMVEIYYKKKSIDLDKEHFYFIKNVFEGRVIKKFLSLKNRINESVDNSNIVEEIMKHTGIKYDGHEFLERSYDNFGRTHDTVIFYFRLPDDDFTYYRRIHFLTRNNKVISVDSAGDFRTIDDAFRYVPTDVLMNYFIEKGKTYLEKFLPKRYPTDSK